MKLRHIAAVSALTAVFVFSQTYASAQMVDMIPAMVDMETDSADDSETEKDAGDEDGTVKKTAARETTADGPGKLYAMSAVLMDGDTGRVLYEKDGDIARPNASTTKVLTCILALENARGDDLVTVSANAAAQPDVQLNIRKGEQYYLKDLLYSLMLKSHNDTAVAIAEHIGGTVEGFARMMNEKAKEIGCSDTHFVTPNGLDAKDSGGIHHTTAHDLALIMRYAINNEAFLQITQTRDYSFSDISKKRNFELHNANALLDMMDGVLSGKTGYTGDAGYCYVCAWESEGMTFVVSLLGCGWPNHKTYKWSDTKSLLEYGKDNYEFQDVWKEPTAKRILVKNGILESQGIGIPVYLRGKCQISGEDRERKVLMKKGEEITCHVNLPEELEAPIKKGQKIGEISYYAGTEQIATYPVTAELSVDKITYKWYVTKVFHAFFH